MENASTSHVDEPCFHVVHPAGRRPVVTHANTSGLGELTGKRIALVWDYLFRGDDIFRLAKERFTADWSDVEFVDYETFGNIHDHEELFDELPSRFRELEIDGTIVATGA